MSRGVVAQLVGSYGGGGAQRAAFNLATALDADGFRSFALALRSRGNFAHSPDSRVEAESFDGGGGLLNAARAMRRLRRFIVDRQVEVLHVHGSASLIASAAALVGLRGLRMYFTWHDSGEVLRSGWLRRHASRWALDRCAGVFGSSTAVAGRLANAWGRGRNVEVFYNGVPATPERGGDRPNGPVVVWMARFVPDKDPELLVRAASILRARGRRFRVILAGSPLDRYRWVLDRVRTLILSEGLTDTISLPGWIDNTETLVRSADIGVQTSHTEGLSMALLEQMMSGLAVVATDVGETRFALDGGRCGVLFAPADLGTLVEALDALILSADQRQSLGRSARERAIENFSLAAMSRQASRAYGFGA